MKANFNCPSVCPTLQLNGSFKTSLHEQEGKLTYLCAKTQ